MKPQKSKKSLLCLWSYGNICEVCVVPVLLFGGKNWILTDSTLRLLESFQGKIGRRILKLSKHHSTLSTRLALRWPSVMARIFLCKLSLLSKVCKESNNIGSHIFSELHQNSLKLVQECRTIEGKLSSDGHTDALLRDTSSPNEIKREVLQADWAICITEASHHQSTATEPSWMKLPHSH